MNARWIAIAFVLGLCAAYALWGGAPAQPVAPTPAPVPVAANPQTPVSAPDPAKAAAMKRVGNALVSFTPNVVEFGDVPVATSKKQTVAVKNVSDRTIHINLARGSCSCIKADVPAMDLEPGKSVDMALTITGFAGKLAEERHVDVFIDEVEFPAEFEVRAKIIQIFEASPDALNFDRIARGQSKTLSTVIRSLDGKPFNILNAQVANKHDDLLITKPEEVPGSNKSAYKLNITITGLHGARIMSQIDALTDDNRAPLVPIKLAADVEGEAVALDKMLKPTAGENGSMIFSTTVKRVTAGPLAVTAVTDSNGATMNFTTEAAGEDSVKLTMTMNNISKRRQPFGELRIQTNVEQEPIRVPYALPHRAGMLGGQ